jgi:hypothetical protein
VRELLKSGKHEITAITRNASSELPAGVKVAQVDYDNEESLVNALRGQQCFIITVSVKAPQETEDKLVAAAAKAGVPWVLNNAYGPDFMNEDLANGMLVGRKIRSGIETIERHGVSSWIGLTCGYWYEFSLTGHPIRYGFDFKNRKIVMYDDGKERINTSTWAQCSQAVARLLSLKELPEDENDTSLTISRWRNQPLYVSSFLVSQRDLLDSVNRVLGSTDADWQIEYESTAMRYKRGLDMLKSGDHMGFVLAMYTRTFFPTGEGNSEDRYGLANAELGLPKEDLDEATARAISWAAEGLVGADYDD